MSLTRSRLAVLLLVSATACAKAQARTAPDRPALDVPDVPAREITAVAEEEPAEEPAQVSEPAPQPSRPRTTRPAPRPEAPKEEPKPEPPKPEPPAAETHPPEPAPPELRMPQAASDEQAVRKIRDQLVDATRALKSVNYGALSTEARSQYDTAKRFIEQAEEALKAKKYVFASYLSDKAGTLARELLGR